jgi:hypothetical protein
MLGDSKYVVFITAVPITKLFARGGGGGDNGGHELRETTSRGLCGLVCPSRTYAFRMYGGSPSLQDSGSSHGMMVNSFLIPI